MPEEHPLNTGWPFGMPPLPFPSVIRSEEILRIGPYSKKLPEMLDPDTRIAELEDRVERLEALQSKPSIILTGNSVIEEYEKLTREKGGTRWKRLR
jgi:hypothetical protein